MSNSYKLYEINEEACCLKCGHKGAVQYYGTWYPNGVGEKANKSSYLAKYRDKQYMSHAIGFGGTIPYKCLNCGNTGLIDIEGLECYKKAFETKSEK